MARFDYEPLNLYDNFATASRRWPDVRIYFDQALPAFPELGLATHYCEVLEAIDRRARQLAVLGIEAGSKVMIFKSPAFDSYLLAVALTKLGAVPVMVSYHLSAEVIRVFGQRLGQGHFLLYDHKTAKTVSQLSSPNSSTYLSIESILEVKEESELKTRQVDLDAIAYMTHTSGTTGIPKLICHSCSSMGWRTLWQKRVLDQMQERKLCSFLVSPVHSRFNIGVSSLMSLGFPMMPLSNPDLASVEAAFRAHPPYAVETHPNHFVQWRSLAQGHPDLFKETKYFHSTFDAINGDSMASFLRAAKANHPVFLQVYGQSECGPMILRAHRLRSLVNLEARDMGQGLGDLTKARICDAEGNPVKQGQPGHIQLYSKGRALTYYQEEERFAENVYGEWWDSGDYGYIDQRGHLYLQDRQVDLLEDLPSTLALEDVLLDKLDFLAEVVIIRDSKGYAQPVIAVNDGMTMDWQAWWELTGDMPFLNKPIVIDWLEYPRTETMKIKRSSLYELLFKQKIHK